MKVGDYVYTPKFCNVRIESIYLSEEFLKEAGYTEPTYNCDDDYIIRGKNIGINRMIFAAAPRSRKHN